MFEQVKPAPPDAILGLTEAFRNDNNPSKINLGVGVYKDDNGHTPILKCVKEAEARLEKEETSKSYLPINGSPEYGKQVQNMLFGDGHSILDSGRALTAHSPGGTGGLRVGGDTIHELSPGAKIWVSKPTWANHKGIFSNAGIEIAEYPYYNSETMGVDWDGMREVLGKVPAGDVVLLHVCCHNPTGVDLNVSQWNEVAGLAEKNGWIPFLDFAYQGFADGLEEDAAPVLPFLDAGIEMFISSSFSKNFGLYSERTGALTLIGKSADAAAAAFSHSKTLVRRNYSNPPSHGGAIVVTVLQDDSLRSLWSDEVAGMRDRIHGMRVAMADGLKARGVERDFSFIVKQRGMFSFSGLRKDQVQRLRDEKSIYVVGDGRINVAGITSKSIDYLCESLAEVLS